tara:strand:+ start:2056 stop:2340 length:285 start_codon:yes stop_codon:yes gene_type:complete
VTPVEEKLLGDVMFSFEVSQICKGKRPPLPKTPLLTMARTHEDVVNTLTDIYKIYGLVNKDLLKNIGDASSIIVTRFANTWKRVGDKIENTSSL